MDLSEIKHIRYGLLNVDEWAEQAAFILTERINDFEVTPENQVQLETSVSNILYTLIDEVEEIMEERTSGGFSGMKKWVAGFALDVEQLRDSVPSFSRTVVEELDKPETKAMLQDYLNEKLDGKKAAINSKVLYILGLVLLSILLNLLSRNKISHVQTFLLILSSFCLLLGGIITPMIEFEAKIDLLQIQLLGEEVSFKDNILFFQSKSITDMVRILMTDGSIQMIFVGILIFSFSIVFPSAKLICSYLYSMDNERIKNNKLIKFFLIKSGKARKSFNTNC